MFVTYMGVRVSSGEATLLQLRLDAKRHEARGWAPLPPQLKQRADWLHSACLRVLDWKARH